LYAEKEDLQDQLEQIQEINHKPIPLAVVKEYSARLSDILKESDIFKSKRFLQTFIESIVITEDIAEVSYTIPLPSEAKYLWGSPEVERCGDGGN